MLTKDSFTIKLVNLCALPKFIKSRSLFTAGACAASSAAPLSSYRQLSLISKDISSLSKLISGVVDFSKSSQGKLVSILFLDNLSISSKC